MSETRQHGAVKPIWWGAEPPDAADTGPIHLVLGLLLPRDANRPATATPAVDLAIKSGIFVARAADQPLVQLLLLNPATFTFLSYDVEAEKPRRRG